LIRVAIVGGGISGLTAAFYLEQERRRGAPIQIVLFEAQDRFGGVIRTERVEGCILETGPDSFLSSKPWARELCEDLRMSSQLVGSRDAERKTYVLLRGKLEPVPPGMQMMVPTKIGPVLKSRLFSTATKLAMLREYFAPPQPLSADEDESVASFISRHFNAELVERLADPLLSGIYGGDVAVLSARATLPNMLEAEGRWRSLVRGSLALRAKLGSGTVQPLFTTVRDGMQRMTEAMVRHLPRETLRSSRAVERIEKSDDCYRIISAGEVEEFDHVILALPAHACAKIIGALPGAERAAELLAEIPYSSTVTVGLAYRASDINLPEGFGFLVPRNEGKRTMACTFVHRKFDNRAPEDTALLRVFLGGTRDPEAIDLSDDEIMAVVRRELRETLGLASEPRFVRVFRWRKAMAQYEVGHLLRVARIQMHLQRFPGLQLSGSAYQGIGIPDCVRMGRSAADAVIRKARSQAPAANS
jgi:oxygen-dependent protoporphyrinogen oxidase